jgi:uncharacterized protein (TIGR00725 family)
MPAAEIDPVAGQGLVGRYVAVIGPAYDARKSDLDGARTIGRLLAERGAIVLTGGHHGVMRAAAQGAAGAGGVSIGLLPGLDREAGSPEHTYLLPTGLGELRNGLLVRAADAVIAEGCSWGTLSEIALARRTGVPLVLVDPWDLPADVGVVVAEAQDAVDAVARLLA